MDEDGNLWVGTSRFGILVLNKQLKTIYQVTDSVFGKRTAFPSAWINAISKDKNGNRWVGTLQGTCIVSKNNFEIISLRNHPLLGEMSKIPCASGFGMMITAKCGIGSTRGAWCYDEKNKTLVNYTTEKGLANNIV